MLRTTKRDNDDPLSERGEARREKKSNPGKSRRVMQALQQMTKTDVEKLHQAHEE